MQAGSQRPFSQHPHLILSMDGLVLREIVLNQERISVGRKSSNQVQIDDLAISGEHVRITTILGDVFLEDLDSTNGTSVNGKPVTRSVLSDGDVVELGKYRMKFVAPSGPIEDAPVAVGDKALQPGSLPPEMKAAAEPAVTGVVRVLDGPHAGREMQLVKARTMLGSPGGQVVAITRKPDGYCLVPIEGGRPIVNGNHLEGESIMLGERTLIELSGVRMEFEVRGS